MLNILMNLAKISQVSLNIVEFSQFTLNQLEFTKYVILTDFSYGGSSKISILHSVAIGFFHEWGAILIYAWIFPLVDQMLGKHFALTRHLQQNIFH